MLPSWSSLLHYNTKEKAKNLASPSKPQELDMITYLKVVAVVDAEKKNHLARLFERDVERHDAVPPSVPLALRGTHLQTFKNKEAFSCKRLRSYVSTVIRVCVC